jgi:hypothetical protein
MRARRSGDQGNAVVNTIVLIAVAALALFLTMPLWANTPVGKQVLSTIGVDSPFKDRELSFTLKQGLGDLKLTPQIKKGRPQLEVEVQGASEPIASISYTSGGETHTVPSGKFLMPYGNPLKMKFTVTAVSGKTDTVTTTPPVAEPSATPTG